MSFLVRGVEMPESCSICPNFMISCDERRQYFCGYTYEEIDGSTAISKPEWCPLVDVSEVKEEIMKLQKYKFSAQDEMVMVSRQSVLEILESEGEQWQS